MLSIKSKLLQGIFIVTLMSVCFAKTISAQDIRASLFSQVDKVLQQTNELRANLLAPDNYEKGMKRYKEAELSLQKGENLQNIRKKIEEAVRYFDKARESTKLAEVTFANLLSARDDAEEVDASKYASKKWNNAEKGFNGAAKELEGGDARDAKKEAANAEKLYREAELLAIKSHILESAHDLLAQADRVKADDQAPKTLEKAKRLMKEAENSLNNNRYDTDEARNLAQQADYEAKHTLFLHKYIEQLDRSRKTREEVILLSEEPLQQVANSLLFNAEFDEGYEKVVGQIVNKITSLKDSLNTQNQMITSLEQEYEALESSNTDLSSKLESLTNEQTEISQRVEAMNKFREQFNTVNNLFTTDEAQVIRDRNNAVIRLKGLNFDVGKSTIKPEYFELLTKVKKAINTFPGSNVIIEGHTDSQGGDELNIKLSQERANAVMSYLLANMNIEPLRIETKGFGETKPIANNETAQGRTLNRRIDIIIKPSLLTLNQQ